MRRRDPVVELLRRVPGMADAPDKDLSALVPLVDVLEVEAGRTLARQGTRGREACVVVEGRGDILIDGELVATVGPGEFVGEMAMLDEGPRTATVRARTAMRVLVIGPRAFETFADHPAAGRAMAVQLSQRLRRVQAPTSS
jgi:CRP-like cAMP-binding protein